MFVVDTNILIYAADRASTHHKQARSLLESYTARGEPWAITWSVVYEFLRVVTHPRVFESPWSTAEALEFVSILLDAPSLVVLSEGTQHLAVLQDLLDEQPATAGNLLHDAHLVALMREHGIRRIQTLDKDFDQFADIERLNPFE
jgi:hypothetical protein